jgi:hypothetical protein
MEQKSHKCYEKRWENRASNVLRYKRDVWKISCIRAGKQVSDTGFLKRRTQIYSRPWKRTFLCVLSYISLFELFVIQNDAISRMTGHWLHAISASLGTEFFQSQYHLVLSLLNILSGSLSLDSPLPPFLGTPRGVSFRALVQERMPEELSLSHVGESGYAVFAALGVSSRLVSREVERCVELVRGLVGEVDLRWGDDQEKKDA